MRDAGTNWGSLQRSPGPSWIKEGGWKGEGRGREMGEKEKGEEEKGKDPPMYEVRWRL